MGDARLPWAKAYGAAWAGTEVVLGTLPPSRSRMRNTWLTLRTP